MDAHDEIATVVIPAGEMPADYLVCNGEKTAAWAFGALDPGLLAEAADPFVGAGRLIAGLAGPSALKAAGIDVVASTKERAEKRDLGLCRRMVIDPTTPLVLRHCGRCLRQAIPVNHGQHPPRLARRNLRNLHWATVPMLPEGQYARQARLASQSDPERHDAGRKGKPHFTFENTNKNTCS